MKKISFIIVGKNQERTIYDCLNSVYIAIEENKLTGYEIIYVDSNSKDRTVEIIRAHFHDVKLVHIKGRMNVAVAKNAGARKATGEVYFFIDGDTTLDKDFISLVYDDKKGLKYELVSGELEEILYNDNWQKIGYIKNRFKISDDEKAQQELGGIFLIKAHIFNSLSGFKEYMKLSEDADLQVRLAEKGFFLRRIHHRIATHHTIFYFSIDRLIEKLFSGDFFYLGVFYRENFTNKYCFEKLLDMQKFTLSLILLIFLSMLIHPIVLLIYPVLIIGKYYLSNRNKCSVFEYILGIIAMDISLLLGFMIFYPKMKEIDYNIYME